LLPRVVPTWLGDLEASGWKQPAQSQSAAYIPPPMTRASSRLGAVAPTLSASEVPTQPTFACSISADKIAKLVDQLGRQDDVTAQQSIENLIQIGSPAVDLLISGLQHGGSIFDNKRKEKDQLCERATRALIGIGVPAIKSLLEAALDKSHFETATEARKAIVQIGAPGLDILIDQIVREERLSNQWYMIDNILCEILHSPSQNQIDAMKDNEKGAKFAMTIGGIIGGVACLISDALIWLPVGIIVGGYVAWSLAWGRWRGWGGGVLIAAAINLFIAPFVASKEIAERKLYEQLRFNMVETLLQSKIHQSPY